jgi:hypothetical protein
MSKLARTLILGATLAAMNLAGMTAVAHAQSNDEPTSRQDARRPPTQRQVGEPWRHGSVASPHTESADAKHRALVERSHSARHGQVASQEQAAADTALRRQTAQEQSYDPTTPAQVPALVPAERSGQPAWLVASLGVLVAALALVAGVAVMAARRAGSKVRPGHAA